MGARALYDLSVGPKVLWEATHVVVCAIVDTADDTGTLTCQVSQYTLATFKYNGSQHCRSALVPTPEAA